MNSIIVLALIIAIESGGNPLAYNKHSQARGLCQITPIVLQEYNARHKQQYQVKHLFLAEINKKIAKWYLDTRIPQMLKYYNKPLTEENILISYNAGISYVMNNKPLPTETREYIIKYKILKEARR